MTPNTSLRDADSAEADIYLHAAKTFRIRETREEDLPVWYRWFNDPEVTQFLMHGLVPNTVEFQEEFRNANLSGTSKIMFSIVAPKEPVLIGTCSINMHGPAAFRRGEISLVLGDSRYRLGPLYLAVTAWQLDHAFFHFNLHSVFAATREDHAVVKGTLERIGMSPAGLWRECSYMDGTYRGAALYDILQPEWRKMRNREVEPS